MSVKRKKEFDRWYAEQQRRQDYVFHFRRELEDCCHSDVKLLKQGCLRFRDEFRAMAHFDPFSKTTIASACSWDLRCNRLEPNTIASEPVTGWRRTTNHSDASIEWLTNIEHQLGRPLQHARNSGEFVVTDGVHKYYLDGYDAVTRTAYEFHGCLWHGCPQCYKERIESHQQLFERNMGLRGHQTTTRMLR